MKSVTQEIEELRQMSVPELLSRYEQLFGKPARVKNREHLWKRCAWKIQEMKFGGLSKKAKDRLEELIGEIDLPLGDKQRTIAGTVRRRAGGAEHKVGTIYTRLWKGREIRAVAVEGGYEWDRVVYRSLSAVAKVVTGSHWNGRLFFGITKRKK